jgi:hypothetical protein
MVKLTPEQVSGLKAFAKARHKHADTALHVQLNAIARQYGFPGWSQLVAANRKPP